MQKGLYVCFVADTEAFDKVQQQFQHFKKYLLGTNSLHACRTVAHIPTSKEAFGEDASSAQIFSTFILKSF